MHSLHIQINFRADNTALPETVDAFAACKSLFHQGGCMVIARGKDEFCPRLKGSVLPGGTVQ